MKKGKRNTRMFPTFNAFTFGVKGNYPKRQTSVSQSGLQFVAMPKSFNISQRRSLPVMSRRQFGGNLGSFTKKSKAPKKAKVQLTKQQRIISTLGALQRNPTGRKSRTSSKKTGKNSKGSSFGKWSSL
mgnify:CR=1 FL=1